MTNLKYGPELLARKTQYAKGSWVRRLFEHPKFEQHARTLERWAVELSAPKTMRNRLVSPDNMEFEAGRWELTAGKLFADMGYEIEVDPEVITSAGGAAKTPDFRATKDGQSILVEVFTVHPDAAEREAEERMAELAEQLSVRLNFDSGMLSVSLGKRLTATPSHAAVDELAAKLQQMIDSGETTMYEHDGHIDLSNARLWPDGAQRTVLLTPPAGVVGGEARIKDRLAKKIGSYQYVQDEPMMIFVASDHWTISKHGMTSAMFGSEQVTFDFNLPDDQQDPTVSFSGAGILVEGHVDGHPGTRVIAGCIFARRTMYSDQSGAWDLDVSFVHNPYSERPLANDTFPAIAEFQVEGPHLRWVREDAPSVRLSG